MERPNVDDLYLSASKGDKLSQEKLFSWYQKRAMKEAEKIAKREGLYTFNRDEVTYKISELFMLTMQSFKVANIPFEKYADFLLKKKLTRIVNSTSIGKDLYPLSIDSTNSNGDCLLDIIPSDTETTPYELSNHAKSSIMGSVNIKNAKINKRFEEFLELKSQGYRRTAILKKMKITEGQYRYLLKYIREINSSNIEMK